MNSDMSIKDPERPVNLLFVEDEPSVVVIAEMYLKHLGYNIRTAYNGREAIEVIKKYHDEIDIIITDYSMPKMNGIELAREARKFIGDKPIVLYTGKSEFVDENQIEDARITRIVIKPCRFDDLDLIIKELVRR